MTDLDKDMKKEDSGFTPIIYDEEKNKGGWGSISHALFDSTEKKRPYLLKVLDQRAEQVERGKKQEFAMVNNLRLKECDGLPDADKLYKAYMQHQQMGEPKKEVCGPSLKKRFKSTIDFKIAQRKERKVCPDIKDVGKALKTVLYQKADIMRSVSLLSPERKKKETVESD